MNQRTQITDYNNQPFPSSEIAIWWRDLLNEVTSNRYQVTLDPAGSGYYVELSQYDDSRVVNKKHIARVPVESVCYRQALRSWILSIPWLVIGSLIILHPARIWTTVFKLLQINAIPQWLNTQQLIGMTSSIGLLLVGVVVLRIVWAYYADRLVITDNGVDRQTGIVSRKTTSLRFSDIRSIGLSQTLFQRLLGIGALEFSSAGSDGVDIRFDNLPNPVIIKERIQQYYRQGG